MDYINIILKPILTEKSLILAKEKNTYSFWVHPKANKTEIKDAIQQAFKVNVVEVNTARLKRKEVRHGRFIGLRKERKKACVQLKAGQKISIFETG